MRTAPAVLLVSCMTAASVVATAGAGSAGGTSTTSAFTWSPTGGSVAGTLVSDAADASPMGLNDYADVTRTDVAWGSFAGTEAASVTASDGTYVCATGRTHYYSGLTVLGNVPDWTQMAVGATTSGRVRLNCTTSNGVVHHFHWGEHQLSSAKWAPPPTPDCVKVTRTATAFTVTASGCLVQHEIVSSRPGKQLSTRNVAADFTATLTPGAVFATS